MSNDRVWVERRIAAFGGQPCTFKQVQLSVYPCPFYVSTPTEFFRNETHGEFATLATLDLKTAGAIDAVFANDNDPGALVVDGTTASALVRCPANCSHTYTKGSPNACVKRMPRRRGQIFVSYRRQILSQNNVIAAPATSMNTYGGTKPASGVNAPPQGSFGSN